MIQKPYCLQHANTKQQRLDMLQLYKDCLVDGQSQQWLNTNCQALLRQNKRITYISELTNFNIADKKDTSIEFREVVEYLRTECRKLCRQSELSALCTRTILGRLGLVRGEVESFDDLSQHLEVPKSRLQKYWTRHGEDVRCKLCKLYYA